VLRLRTASLWFAFGAAFLVRLGEDLVVELRVTAGPALHRSCGPFEVKRPESTSARHCGPVPFGCLARRKCCGAGRIALRCRRVGWHRTRRPTCDGAAVDATQWPPFERARQASNPLMAPRTSARRSPWGPQERSGAHGVS
jgi:hypothetical protein